MNYFIIDLEATCWGADNVQHKQEIIEIGACYINSYMEVEKHFPKLLNL